MLITEPFVPTADAMAELSGMAGYGYVVAEHPVTSLNADGVAARADAALDRVEELLLNVPRDGAVPNATSGLEGLLAELAPSFRADGGDLVGAVADGHVHLELIIPDEACAECIMPADHLTPIFEAAIARHLGKGRTLVLSDPRR